MADDKTPPQITTGSFVSWSGGKGRVDLVVRSGKVPGVDDDVEATGDSPAARVVVWKDGKATREKIAASTHTLRRIPPLDGSDGKTGLAAVIDMQTKHAEYVEDAGLPSGAQVTALAARTAFERGQASWPGREATTLTAEEWGVGRAQHLMKVALMDETETNDADLLSEGHLLAPVEEQVVVAVDDVARTLADIEHDAAEAGRADEDRSLG